MPFKEVNEHMVAQTIKILEIPLQVSSVTLSIGIPRLQDSDSQRTIWLSPDDQAIPVPESYFEQTVVGLSPEEEQELVHQVIEAICRQHFIARTFGGVPIPSDGTTRYQFCRDVPG